MRNNSQAIPLQPGDSHAEDSLDGQQAAVEMAAVPGSNAAEQEIANQQPGGPQSAHTASSLGSQLGDTWLDWQCKMIAGVIHGTLYTVIEENDALVPVSHWPKQDSSHTSTSEIANAAYKDKQRKVVTRHRYGTDGKRICDLLACPLVNNGNVTAVVVCAVSTRSEAQQQAILQLLQWGSLWLETLVRQQNQASRGYSAFSHRLVCKVLAHQNWHAASMEASSRLAEQFTCQRASISFLDGLQVRLGAISDVANFDHKSNLVRQLEAAMEEAINQKAVIALPKVTDAQTATRPLHSKANEKLALKQQHPTVLTVPLLKTSNAGPEIIGALTLERTGHSGFTREEIEQVQWIAEAIGPALALKKDNEKPARQYLMEHLRRGAEKLVGPENARLKLGTLAVVAALLLCSIIPGEYRVTAPAQVEADSRQVLVAPIDGYIQSVQLRAGDLVKEGEQIASLQTNTLELEQKKWESEILTADKEYQQALGERDRKKLSVYRAKLDQLEAERNLVAEQITRTKIVAPFDGIIVSGDLSNSLGAAVRIGDELFEVAPINDYRVTLEIDEFDMQGVRPGATGRLVLAALPGSPLDITLEQLMPVAVSEDGRNFFRIEAVLAGAAPDLRPGMRGVAKIHIGEKPLLWIWTHSLVDRLRLWAWSAGL